MKAGLKASNPLLTIEHLCSYQPVYVIYLPITEIWNVISFWGPQYILYQEVGEYIFKTTHTMIVSLLLAYGHLNTL